MRSVRLRITGRVQGVGYRAWTIATAERLGLRGWVRNRADGSVEALVAGEDTAVGMMITACRDGPLGARVRDVAIGEGEDDGSVGFGARPTA
jgi:acylphosphatase